MINKIALGTAQFGLDYGISNVTGKVPADEVKTILSLCLENGVDTIDTASAYGEAEAVLGSCGGLNAFRIVTKSNPADTTAFQIERRFQDSLDHLRMDRVEGLLIHDFELYRADPRLMDALMTLKIKNKVSKIGFSVYYPEQLGYLFSTGVSFDIVQLPYNLLDDRFGPLLDTLKGLNVEVHSRSTFLQGLFFLPKEKKQKYFPEIAERLDQLEVLARTKAIPLSALLLNFVLAEDRIDRVIIGVESAANLRENLRAVSFFKPVSDMVDGLKAFRIHDENILLPFNWKITE